MPSSASKRAHAHLRSCRPTAHEPRICVVDPRAGDHSHWNTIAPSNRGCIQHVTTPAAALRLARSQTVDLWVINAELPDLSGAELCSMLKARGRQVPVLVVADRYSTDLERAALAARATAFCVKPLEAAWLAQWWPGPGQQAALVDG